MGDARGGRSGGGWERGVKGFFFGVCIVGSARLCVTYRKSTLKCLIQLIKIRKGGGGVEFDSSFSYRQNICLF